MILIVGYEKFPLSKIIFEMCKEQRVPCTLINEKNINENFIKDELTQENFDITWKDNQFEFKFSSISGILNLLQFPLNIRVTNNLDDDIFYVEQFIAYFSFALHSHRNVFNMPKNGNVNSNLFSVIHFWEYLSSKKIKTPKWGYSIEFLNSLSKTEKLNLIFSDNLFDYNNWNTSKRDKSILYYLRPPGIHILVAFINDYYILSTDLQNFDSEIQNIMNYLKCLDINFGELLLFHDHKFLTFGSFSPNPNMEQYSLDNQKKFTNQIIAKLYHVD